MPSFTLAFSSQHSGIQVLRHTRSVCCPDLLEGTPSVKGGSISYNRFFVWPTDPPSKHYLRVGPIIPPAIANKTIAATSSNATSVNWQLPTTARKVLVVLVNVSAIVVTESSLHCAGHRTTTATAAAAFTYAIDLYMQLKGGGLGSDHSSMANNCCCMRTYSNAENVD